MNFNWVLFFIILDFWVGVGGFIRSQADGFKELLPATRFCVFYLESFKFPYVVDFLDFVFYELSFVFPEFDFYVK